MATLNLGRIKPVFKGAWNSGAFVIDDIVTHGNETFICIQAGTNKATSDASYWTKLAAKGTDGTDVGTTITTQGDILYRDGSGLQRLAKGTASQTLTMNSGATAPEWTTPSAGGAWNFISNTTISSDSSVLVTGLDSTYDVYKLYAVSINNSTSDGTWLYQWQSGGSIQTSNYRYASYGFHSAGSAQGYESQSASGMKCNNNGNQTDTNRPQNHEVTIYHPSNTSHYKHILVNGVYINNDSNLYGFRSGGVWESTAAVTGINLIRDGGGTFTTGNLYLYGLSKS